MVAFGDCAYKPAELDLESINTSAVPDWDSFTLLSTFRRFSFCQGEFYQTVLALPNVEESHKGASRFTRSPFQGKMWQ